MEAKRSDDPSEKELDDVHEAIRQEEERHAEKMKELISRKNNVFSRVCVARARPKV